MAKILKNREYYLNQIIKIENGFNLLDNKKNIKNQKVLNIIEKEKNFLLDKQNKLNSKQVKYYNKLFTNLELINEIIATELEKNISNAVISIEELIEE